MFWKRLCKVAVKWIDLIKLPTKSKDNVCSLYLSASLFYLHKLSFGDNL